MLTTRRLMFVVTCKRITWEFLTLQHYRANTDLIMFEICKHLQHQLQFTSSIMHEHMCRKLLLM